MASTPITDRPPIDNYIAYAGQKDFEFTFWLESQADLCFFVDGVQRYDFSVMSGLQNDSGGTMRAVNAMVGGEKVVLVRQTEIDRASGFSESGGGSFTGQAINFELTRIIAMIQDQAFALSRSLKLSLSTVFNGVSLFLPDPEPGKGIVWNEEGTGFDNTEFNLSDIEDSASSAEDSANRSQASANAAANSAFLAQNAANAAGALVRKGDILTRSDSGNVALKVGRDGLVLTADSSTITGMAWAQGMPIGAELPYHGKFAPPGFLMLEVGAVGSRTVDAGLFAVLGTDHGVGDGVTTFGLPAAPGRVLVGLDKNNSVLTNPLAKFLASLFGEEKHALTPNEGPLHSHAYTAWSASGSGASNGSGNGGLSATTGNSGLGTPHNNVQPSRTANFIIKTGGFIGTDSGIEDTLLAHWEADASGTVTLDNSLGYPVVTKWRDKLTGVELRSPSLAGSPNWVAISDMVSARPAIAFDGVDDWLETLAINEAFLSLPGITVSLLLYTFPADTDTLDRIVWIEAGEPGHCRFGYGRSAFSADEFYADGMARDLDPYVFVTGSQYPYDGWATHTVRRDYYQGVERVDFNGGLVASSANIPTLGLTEETPSLRFRIGAENLGANPGNFYVYGIKVYQSYISDAEMAADASYFGGKINV